MKDKSAEDRKIMKAWITLGVHPSKREEWIKDPEMRAACLADLEAVEIARLETEDYGCP